MKAFAAALLAAIASATELVDAQIFEPVEDVPTEIVEDMAEDVTEGMLGAQANCCKAFNIRAGLTASAA